MGTGRPAGIRRRPREAPPPSLPSRLVCSVGLVYNRGGPTGHVRGRLGHWLPVLNRSQADCGSSSPPALMPDVEPSAKEVILV